jgi:hypothetical protein
MAARRTVRWLAAGLTALIVAAALGCVAWLAAAHGSEPAVAAVAVIAIVALAAGIATKSTELVGLGVGALGASCTISLLGNPVAIGVPAFLGTGLLVVFEVSTSAIDRWSRTSVDRLARGRADRDGALAVVAGLVAACFVATAGAAGRGAGGILFLAGFLAAAGLAGLFSRGIHGAGRPSALLESRGIQQDADAAPDLVDRDGVTAPRERG